MAKALLPHGIHDLKQGVEQLLTNCFNQAERNGVAALIVQTISGIADDAEAIIYFKRAVNEFAMDCRSPEHVRNAYLRFEVEIIPIIVRRNMAKGPGSKGGKVSTKLARDDLGYDLEQELEKMVKEGIKLPAFRNVQKMVEALHVRLPGRSESTLRRGVEARPDLHLWVESLPPRLRR